METEFKLNDKVRVRKGTRYEQGTVWNPSNEVIGTVILVADEDDEEDDYGEVLNIQVRWPNSKENSYAPIDLEHAYPEKKEEIINNYNIY